MASSKNKLSSILSGHHHENCLKTTHFINHWWTIRPASVMELIRAISFLPVNFWDLFCHSSNSCHFRNYCWPTFASNLAMIGSWSNETEQIYSLLHRHGQFFKTRKLSIRFKFIWNRKLNTGRFQAELYECKQQTAADDSFRNFTGKNKIILKF